MADPVSQRDLDGLDRQVKSFADLRIPDLQAKRPVRIETRRRQIGAQTLVGYDWPQKLNQPMLNRIAHRTILQAWADVRHCWHTPSD